MKLLELKSILVAAVLIGTTLFAGTAAAGSLEHRYAYVFAPVGVEQKLQGKVIQNEILQMPDLLPVYGSSELPSVNPYAAGLTFQTFPTGFGVAVFGKGGTTPINILQKLASAGSELRGKKVVLSISPSWFFKHPETPADQYAGNFSALHAGEFVFSNEIGLGVKQAAAKRMLEYPDTLAPNPLLQFALQQLADGSPLSLARYYAVMPLGKLQNLVLTLQDHWETLNVIWGQPELNPVPVRQAAPIDWAALARKAAAEYHKQSNNNPFGLDNHGWLTGEEQQAALDKGSLTDEQFLKAVADGKDWGDLELVLQELHALGAQPLLISLPIHGPYYDFMGVSRNARQAYYDKIEALAARYQVPLRDFAAHDGDHDFLIDSGAHMAPPGWVLYNQVLDAFYHGTLTP